VFQQGPYVLVMVNTGRSHRSNRLQASWLVSAYRGLSRPFRKNVKYIILVRPSKPLKAFLTVLRPFLSRKAHRKVVKVGVWVDAVGLHCMPWPACPAHACLDA
jgi:hypothetical protein